MNTNAQVNRLVNMAAHPKPKPRPVWGNGVLPLVIGGHLFPVYGGPYRNTVNAEGIFGVKLDPLQKLPCALDVPVQDFGLPTDPEAFVDAAYRALKAVAAGKTVYVGCMGGIGRTGLFLAIMAKLCGEVDPVAYVRKFYLPHAVETRQQEEFVAETPVAGYGLKMAWLNFKTYVGILS